MEYVVVRCDDDADLPVWIDDRQSGRTGKALGVQRGFHKFALCECAAGEHADACAVTGYRPVSQEITVRNTSFIRPLEVSFERA